LAQFKARVLGFDRVTGSIFFLKSKRRRFSKKKKQKSTGYNRFFDRVTPPGHTEFFFTLFFLQLGSVPTPGPGLTRRAGFQNNVPDPL
jgi:hypothetical protein